MKKRNSAHNHLLTALLVGGIFMTGALSVNAQLDDSVMGSDGGRSGGFLGGSGNRNSGMLGSGAGLTDDGGQFGSDGAAKFSLSSVWEFIF